MRNILLKGIVPAFALMLMTIPQAFAGPVGDAFKNTVQSERFSYDATASIQLEQSEDVGLPFDLLLSVQEDGGKSNGIYAKEGRIGVVVDNILDLPGDLADTTKVTAGLTYQGMHEEATQTTYAGVQSIDLSSDGKKMSDIVEMFEEMFEIMTGKTYKLSATVLAERLGDILGGDIYGPSEEELLMAALTGGTQSIDDLLMALADMLDASIESGLLNANSSLSRTARGRGSNEYTITLGSKMSVSGAATFRDALANFLEAFLPGLGSVAAEEIRQEDPEVIANDLNDMLAEIQGLDVEMNILITDEKVTNVSFMADLSSLEVPFTIRETVDFDYSSSFSVVMPSDDEDIIDMNEIINGFITIGEMGGSLFNTYVSDFDTYDYDYDYDYTDYAEPVSEWVDYISPTSLIAEDLYAAESSCDYDSVCMTEEIIRLRDWLNGMHDTGAVTDMEYRQGITDLRNSLRYYEQFIY